MKIAFVLWFSLFPWRNITDMKKNKKKKKCSYLSTHFFWPQNQKWTFFFLALCKQLTIKHILWRKNIAAKITQTSDSPNMVYRCDLHQRQIQELHNVSHVLLFCWLTERALGTVCLAELEQMNSSSSRLLHVIS